MDETESDRDLLHMANEILVRFGMEPYLKDLSECDHKYFVTVYETMIGKSLTGITSAPDNMEDRVRNVQVVIDSLASDVLGIDISHVNAEMTVNKDKDNIRCLLEIFNGLLEFVLEEVEMDLQEAHSQQEEADNSIDSNKLDDDHEILSDVLNKEFGESYEDNIPTYNNQNTRKHFTTNTTYQQRNTVRPSETGDSVTWKSGNNNHTVTWSNSQLAGALSPSGESTATDELIHLAQLTGNSTDELIKEAQSVQKDLQSHRFSLPHTKVQQEEDISKADGTFSFTSNWSSILSTTSSAVEDVVQTKEHYQEPEPCKRLKKKQEEDIAKADGSFPFTSNWSSILSTTSAVKDVVQTKEHNQELEPCKRLIKKQEQLHACPQFHNSEYTTKSRSEQLADLSERLLKHQQVQPKIPVTLNDKEDETRQSNIVSKEKKDKVKVSFNLDSLLDEYHYSMSDTEVDYATPAIETESKSQKDTLHEEIKVHRGRGRQRHKKQESPHRSILRNKSSQADSSTSADETSASEDLTAKFEKPFFKRDERLRKLKKGLKEEEKENKHSVRKIRDQYTKHHGKLKNQEKIVRKQSNLHMKEVKEKEKVIKKFDTSPAVRRSPRLKNTPVSKYAAKLSVIYGNGSPKRAPDTLKGKKRSASVSPIRRRKYKTPMVLEEHEILPVMEDEFPFIHLSPHTAKLMWQKQLRQIGNLSKHTKPHKTSKIQRTIEDAQRKQKALAEVMKKEIEHNRRLKELKERKEEDTVVRRNLQERRQRSARARRYYNEYAVRNKARMLKKRTKEEKIFKQLFEDGLEIQKQRIKEMRDYAREQKEKNAKKQKDEIESLENFYRDKFACLAESVAEEKFEVEVRQSAQAQVLDKMRRGMRKRMEKDLKDIQEQLQNDDDAYYFRQLDADVLKKEFQLATYKASRFK